MPVERAAWMPIISALASEIGPPQIVKPLPLSVDISLVLATVTAVAGRGRPVSRLPVSSEPGARLSDYPMACDSEVARRGVRHMIGERRCGPGRIQIPRLRLSRPLDRHGDSAARTR